MVRPTSNPMSALFSADRLSQLQADEIPQVPGSFLQREFCRVAETWTLGSDVPHSIRGHRSQDGILGGELRP